MISGRTVGSRGTPLRASPPRLERGVRVTAPRAYADLVARVAALIGSPRHTGGPESSAEVAERVVAEVTSFVLEWTGA